MLSDDDPLVKVGSSEFASTSEVVGTYNRAMGGNTSMVKDDDDDVDAGSVLLEPVSVVLA